MGCPSRAGEENLGPIPHCLRMPRHPPIYTASSVRRRGQLKRYSKSIRTRRFILRCAAFEMVSDAQRCSPPTSSPMLLKVPIAVGAGRFECPLAPSGGHSLT